MADFEINININDNGRTILPHNTTSFFDVNYTENTISPLDSFIEKIDEFNLLIGVLDASPILSQTLKITNYNLILLGQISAVESYLREIIRKLIIIDYSSAKSSSSCQLTYGAAINYSKNILPEALMENYSFASQKNILEAFKTFLDIKGHPNVELIKILEEFEKICQLRHCIIHRFGKLGGNNAIKLGLNEHAECLEKPLALNTSHLSETYFTCLNLVLVINNYLFKKILARTINENYWEWDLRKDKKKFKIYLDVFSSVQKPDSFYNNDLNKYHSKLKEIKKNYDLSRRSR